MKTSNELKYIDIADRLELFVDDYLVAAMNGTTRRLHTPCRMPRPQNPLTGAYITVIKDGDIFRAYARHMKPGSDLIKDGNSNECTCYFESRDGIEWESPDLDIIAPEQCGGMRNVIINEPPFAHNFSPFLDTHPEVNPDERFKALAGLHGSGLFAFASADGLHWRKMQDTPVIRYQPEIHGPWAFDSQNVAFYCAIEQKYVAFFRHMKGPQEPLRAIGRATSTDFLKWHDESATFQPPNLPGEHLYTNQTHPYFRAPHLYLALPTRFALGMVQGQAIEGNLGSTDILLMTLRPGNNHYDRLFKEAFIRPGPHPENWDSRANYTALNVVPTQPTEISIYNRDGHRYVIRTDGFASIHAAFEKGEMLTRPLIFCGDTLTLNISTSVIGSVQVELQSRDGSPIPGFTLADCAPITGDHIQYPVSWQGGSIGKLAGHPVQLRFVMNEADLYSIQFQKTNSTANKPKQEK
ncbi:MAG: hypothetical protein GX230_04430 [Lentisphaerae bacterium]|nr:hypothetical protein [Lentisphaerota bacterium]